MCLGRKDVRYFILLFVVAGVLRVPDFTLKLHSHAFFPMVADENCPSVQAAFDMSIKINLPFETLYFKQVKFVDKLAFPFCDL